MTVFSGLGGGHIHDLARAALDHDVTAAEMGLWVSLSLAIGGDLRQMTHFFRRAEHCIGYVVDAPAKRQGKFRLVAD